MKETSSKLFPYPYLILLNFVITFMLFPGPTLRKTFPSVANSWSVVIFLFSYNIGDAIGKYMGEIKDIFNKASLIYIFFCRLIFFLPIVVMANGSD